MYHTPMLMTQSEGLKARLAGAAASEGRADAPAWVEQNIWRLISDDSWTEAWEYAEATKTPNVNPDTGARNDVINDSQLLARVQFIIAEDMPEEPTEGPTP